MKKIILLLTGLFLLLMTHTASGSYILGYNEDETKFQMFDMDTNTTQDLTYNGSAFDQVEGLTHATGNTYYGINSYNDGTESMLYSFELDFELDGDDNKITGEKTNPFTASNIDAAVYINGLIYAFDNKTDTLMSISTDGVVQTENHVKGVKGGKKIEGLAYNGGLLYGTATKGSNSWLYSIDLDNPAKAEEVGKIKGYGQVEALTFLDDVLYGVGNNNNNPLMSINTSNGNVISIANWGAGDIEGIATVGGSDAVPEPAIITLLGIGLIGFLRKKFFK